MFHFNFIEKLKVVFNIEKKKKHNLIRGADGGEIFIAARKIRGDGEITANGGDGAVGGKGGKVVIVSEDNQFKGKISSKGGKSSGA